ncbi:MAG: hypothetical protein ABI563_19725 [Specibacter sp.]
MAMAFFLSGMATEKPDPSGSPSGMVGDRFLQALFFMECLVLWAFAGLAEWFRKVLRSDEEYLTITDSGTYVGLMTRAEVASEVLLALTAAKR